MVRRGDDEWFTIVKWAIYALIEAERPDSRATSIR
jgi:hypothetical protein